MIADTQPLLPDRYLDACVGVGDAECGPLHAPSLEFAEEGPPGVLRLVEYGFYGQELPGTCGIDPAGDHHGHGDHPSLDPDLLMQGIDPDRSSRRRGISFTGGMGFLLTATMGIRFTMTLGIQLTISKGHYCTPADSF
jgi:hypothetical protein